MLATEINTSYLDEVRIFSKKAPFVFRDLFAVLRMKKSNSAANETHRQEYTGLIH